MGALNISKVAVGCASLDALAKRQRLRLSGGVVPIVTRFMPKRADELVGGSIYWIVKHRITARQSILALAVREDRKTVISLDPELIPVSARAKRAHQGWRYLDGVDAPPDLGDGDDDGLAALPPRLSNKLAGLALI